MNPKDAKKADPHLIFQTAEAFTYSAHFLTDHVSERAKLIRSAVVTTNSALALELFIKCLLMLEHGAYIEEHHLSKLFMLLRRQTRESIDKEWRQFVANVSWFRELEKEGKGNLEAVLSLGADAFVRFRYPFEPALEKCVWILDSLILILRSRIVDINPEWGAIGERSPRSISLDPQSQEEDGELQTYRQSDIQ